MSGLNTPRTEASRGTSRIGRADRPGTKEANWLPAPAGTFVLMLRLYWPKATPPSIVDGSWKIPRVREAS